MHIPGQELGVCVILRWVKPTDFSRRFSFQRHKMGTACTTARNVGFEHKGNTELLITDMSIGWCLIAMKQSCVKCIRHIFANESRIYMLLISHHIILQLTSAKVKTSGIFSYQIQNVLNEQRSQYFPLDSWRPHKFRHLLFHKTAKSSGCFWRNPDGIPVARILTPSMFPATCHAGLFTGKASSAKS